MPTIPCTYGCQPSVEIKSQRIKNIRGSTSQIKKIWISIDDDENWYKHKPYISFASLNKMSVRHPRACYCKTIIYVDWISLRRVSSVLSIVLTCGKWVWCQTLNSNSSMLLPSHFCTPLNEPGRPGKDKVVNEVGGMSRRWMLRQGRVNSHLRWPNSSSNTLHRI